MSIHPNERILCFEKPSAIHETAKNYFDTKEVCYVNSEDGSESVSANAIGMGTKLSEFILKKKVKMRRVWQELVNFFSNLWLRYF